MQRSNTADKMFVNNIIVFNEDANSAFDGPYTNLIILINIIVPIETENSFQECLNIMRLFSEWADFIWWRTVCLFAYVLFHIMWLNDIFENLNNKCF